jgi:peptide/nickel transport system substrate-binding protein
LKRESLPFFKVKEIRQALMYGMDRQLLIDQALSGQGLIADSPVLPYSWAFDPSVRRYRFDPERAVGLLDASGWLDSNANRIRDKDGTELRFTLLTSADPTMAQMADSLSRQWQTLGIQATVQPVGPDALAQSVRDRAFDAALIEIEVSADPDPYPLWHSTQAEAGQNFVGFADEQADVVMEEGRLNTDPKRQLELLHAFQQIYTEEVPSLLLYYPIYNYAVSAAVGGLQIPPLVHTSDRFRNVEDWYVMTEELVVSEQGNLDKNEQ